MKINKLRLLMVILSASIFIFIFLLLPLLIHRKPESKGSGSSPVAWLFVSTLVSSSYGWVSGAGQVYAEQGAIAWLYLSLPYFLFFLLFYFIFNKATTPAQFHDLGELVFHKRGKWFAYLCLPFILVINSPAMYMLMAAQLLSAVFVLDMNVSILLVTVASFFHVLLGGFEAILKNDRVKFFLMYVGFFTCLAFFFTTEPQLGRQLLNSDYFKGNADWPYFFTWLLLAAIVLIDPANYQRFAYAYKHQGLKKGMLLAVIAWLVFDGFLMFNAGIALQLDGQQGASTDIYYVLAKEHLPYLLQLFLLISMMAAFISTADSYIYSSAVTMYFAFYKNAAERRSNSINVCVVLTVLINLVIVLLYKDSSVVDILFSMFPICINALLIPLLVIYFEKEKWASGPALVHLIITLAICLFLHFSGLYYHEVYASMALGAGILASWLVYLVIRYSNRNTGTAEV